MNTATVQCSDGILYPPLYQCLLSLQLWSLAIHVPSPGSEFWHVWLSVKVDAGTVVKSTWGGMGVG